MQLSRFSDYSLRVLFYVAVNDKRLANLAEIADFYNISLDHLRKVVHNLGKQGYLKTYRGKKGGFCLARAASEINLGALVAMTEGRLPLIDCAGQSCRLSPHCHLQSVLAEAQSAFFNVLSQYTLADLIADRQMQRLIKVEQIDAASPGTIETTI